MWCGNVKGWTHLAVTQLGQAKPWELWSAQAGHRWQLSTWVPSSMELDEPPQISRLWFGQQFNSLLHLSQPWLDLCVLRLAWSESCKNEFLVMVKSANCTWISNTCSLLCQQKYGFAQGCNAPEWQRCGCLVWVCGVWPRDFQTNHQEWH